MGLTMRELCPASEADGSQQWFALTVRHQHERRTSDALQDKGLETLMPVYRSRRAWTDRVKEIEAPLFPGYLLCRFALEEKLRVMNTPGVAKIVGFGGAPVPVRESEIEGLQAVISSGLALRPWPYLKAGDRVRVERGPLRGIEGTLLAERGRLSLVIGVEILQRSVVVQLEQDMVTPIRVSTARAGA
jgi:transcription termination/antitermination protein NusG